MSAKKKFDPITIRYKMLANGNRSIYLDYKLSDGTRKLEYLKMYLLPGRGADIKRLNEHTLRAVANIKAQRLVNMAWSKDPNAGVEDSKRLLFDVIDEYSELRTRRGSKGAKGYYASVKRYVRYINPEIRMWEVNLDFVTALADYMMNTARTAAGEPLAKATITSVIGSLSAVLRYAVRKGMIQSNPVELYDTRKVDGPVYKRIYLIADELKRLVDTPCSNEDYKNLFMFACFVGLRFSDLISLKWKDIVEEEGTLRIEKMMSKTKHMVYIPLNKVAESYLPPRGAFDDLVFANIPRTTSPMDVVLKEWAKAAGIEKHVTFYTSRHTFATLSLTQGADLYSVSQLLGHKQIKTTEGYAEIIDPKKEEAVHLIDALFKDYLTAKEHLRATQKHNGAPLCEEAKLLLSQAIRKSAAKVKKKNCYMLDEHLQHLEKYIGSLLPTLRLWEFDETHLQRFVDYLEQEAIDEKGNRLCRAQVETMLGTLNKVMDCYKERSCIKVNPVAGYDYSHLQGEVDDSKSLSDEELQLMLESPCDIPYIKPMFLFCCYCDLMMVHAMKLKWGDIIDNPDGSKMVRITYGRYNTIRMQPIPKLIVPLLPERGRFEDLVFPHAPKLQRTIVMDLERWCLSIGIYRHIVFMHSQYTFCRLVGKKKIAHYTYRRKKNGYYD